MSIIQYLKPGARLVSVRSDRLDRSHGALPVVGSGGRRRRRRAHRKREVCRPGTRHPDDAVRDCKDRRDVVKASMLLTDTEAKVFGELR